MVASSTYLTLLVKECICPCALSTSAGQNLHLSIKGSTIIFHLKATKFVLLLLLKYKSEIMHPIFGIQYHTHISNMIIEALLNQPLQFIIMNIIRKIVQAAVSKFGLFCAFLGK